MVSTAWVSLSRNEFNVCEKMTVECFLLLGSVFDIMNLMFVIRGQLNDTYLTFFTICVAWNWKPVL